MQIFICIYHLMQKEVNMVVERDYMLKKGAGPSSPKLFLDTRVIPLVVNLAGALEVALNHASTRTGVRPSVICTGVATLGILAVLRLRRGSRSVGTRRA
jgi:hypothetical protein